MRACENSMSFANLAIHHCCFACARVDMQVLCVARENLHPSILELIGINKRTAAIIIALESLRYTIVRILEGYLVDLDIRSPRSSLASILEAFECQPPANSGEQAQFAVTHHCHLRIIDLEFASSASIVAPSAEAKIRAAAVQEAGDATIAIAIERTTVAQISTTRKDDECARAEPRLFDDNVACDGYDSVRWREKSLQGVETMSHRLGSATMA
jgi:hypothetical protein